MLLGQNTETAIHSFTFTSDQALTNMRSTFTSDGLDCSTIWNLRT